MRIAHVDAFASQPFAGNPAGVCLLDRAEPADRMWRLAAELNLPKTAFLRPLAAEHFELRWFGVNGESDLCGHATLASAHRLWETGAASGDCALTFATRSGALVARRLGDGWIEIEFPAEVAAEEPCDEVAAALGVARPLWMGRNRLHHLIEVADEGEVRALRPDFRRVAAALTRAGGVMVTAPAAAAAGGYDFVSRHFGPPVGVDEDAVTGSAHCALAPYWSARLGKTEMLAYQASARGGWLRLRVAGDRVHVAGQAITLWHGEIAGNLTRGEETA